MMHKSTITARDKLGRIMRGNKPGTIEKIKFLCVECGKIFFKHRCQVKTGKPFCSRKCYWKNKKSWEHKWLHTKKVCLKISRSLKGKSYPSHQNSKHHSWKGKDAGYFAFHGWLERKYGKANHCENPDCIYPRINANGKILKAPKKFHWSLIHGKRHGHDRKRYRQLCASCHIRYDKNLIDL